MTHNANGGEANQSACGNVSLLIRQSERTSAMNPSVPHRPCFLGSLLLVGVLLAMASRVQARPTSISGGVASTEARLPTTIRDYDLLEWVVFICVLDEFSD